MFLFPVLPGKILLCSVLPGKMFIFSVLPGKMLLCSVLPGKMFLFSVLPLLDKQAAQSALYSCI